MTAIRGIRRNASEWTAIMADYARSGLSQRVFCEQSELSIKSFARWRRRLRTTVVEQPEFVAVRAESTEEVDVTRTSWDMELELGDGMTLRIRRSS